MIVLILPQTWYRSLPNTTFELEYWEERQFPPNISSRVFRSIVQLIPESIVPKWKVRKSIAGLHGLSGEDSVFNFEFATFAFGNEIRFYCKGFFFDKGNLKGVAIQSFRPSSLATIIPIRGDK